MFLNQIFLRIGIHRIHKEARIVFHHIERGGRVQRHVIETTTIPELRR